jgi:hypothetical protein
MMFGANITNSTVFPNLKSGDIILISTQSFALFITLLTLVLLIFLRSEKILKFRGITPFTGVIASLFCILKSFIFGFTPITFYTDK